MASSPIQPPEAELEERVREASRGRSAPQAPGGQHARHTVPLSQAPISTLEAAVREPTRPHLRTDTKTKMREQFERLPADDQALIQLRIDQRLSWRDPAVVFECKGKVPSETESKASAAKLSQRFHRLTDRLRQSPQRSTTS